MIVPLIAKEIIKINPDIVALSITTPQQFVPAFTLIKLMKNKRPNIPILLGGEYISNIFQSIISHPVFKNLFDFIN